ncbi:MAG: T9SS type A sorting domain-containing protein, partial [Flavobacteriales bacterium]|nr:T9SS type A sorting domain-containing protein [Flavobacteriales bacterium]
TVIDSCGTNATCQNVSVTSGGCPLPTAGYISNASGLTIQFIDVSAITGGASYLWDFGDGSGSSIQQDPSYTYALDGTYNVCLNVTDNCGSNAICQMVTALAGGCTLSVVAGSTNESAPGLNDGTGTAVATLGTAPYTYLWNDPNATSSAIVSGLVPGIYSVTVTDASSCTDTATITVLAGSTNCQVQLTVMASDESAAGANDGSASTAVTGGTPPYAYVWSTGATTTAISGLAPGVYTCNILDADQCTVSQSFTVQAFPCNLSGVISSAGESSAGANDGSATAVGSGGTGPYTYVWSNFETTSTIVNLSPGIYDVTITDFTGCTYTASAAVNPGGVPCNLSTTISGSNESQAGANDGSATVVVNGGSPPTSILWDNGQTTSAISGLAPGDYTVVVQDGLGCFSTATYTVSPGLFIGIKAIAKTNVFVHLYPNPATDLIHIEIIGGERSRLAVFDYSGRLAADQIISQELTVLKTRNFKDGIYLYQLFDTRGVRIGSGKFVIQR